MFAQIFCENGNGHVNGANPATSSDWQVGLTSAHDSARPIRACSGPHAPGGVGADPSHDATRGELHDASDRSNVLVHRADCEHRKPRAVRGQARTCTTCASHIEDTSKPIGDARVGCTPTHWNHHQAFLRWAAAYDHGSEQVRSLVRHEASLERLACPVFATRWNAVDSRSRRGGGPSRRPRHLLSPKLCQRPQHILLVIVAIWVTFSLMGKRLRRAGETVTFSVSVDRETKRLLRAIADRSFRGNVSELITQIALQAARQEAAGELLRAHGRGPMTETELSTFEAEIARDLEAQAKPRRRGAA